MPNVNIESNQYVRRVEWSGTTSNIIKILPGRSYQLFVPASFQGATVSFLVRIEGEDASRFPVDMMKPFHKDGALLSVTVSADACNYLPAELFSGAAEIQIVSDIAETAVTTGWLLMST